MLFWPLSVQVQPTNNSYRQNDLLFGFLNAVRRTDKHSLNLGIFVIFYKNRKCHDINFTHKDTLFIRFIVSQS